MFLIILAWICCSWQVGSSMGRPCYKSYALMNGGFGDSHEPVAIRYGWHTYISSVDKNGNIIIMDYDHRFGNHTFFTLHPNLEVNLHDNPSLLLRNDNKLIAFYCKHGGDTLRYRISTNPLDISAWGAEQKVYIGPTITYPTPIKLDGENKIYLFFRGPADLEEWSYITSTDSGTTWSSINTFFREVAGNHDYIEFATDGDSIIHFMQYGHALFEDSDLFYFRYKNDSLYRIDGTVVGSLAGDTIFRSEMDTIYKQSDVGHNEVFRGNIAIDSLNNPYYVFTTYSSADHCIFNWGYWNGSSWNTDTITSADSLLENYFVSTIDIDDEQLNRVYFWKWINGYREIYRASTNDNGDSWNIQQVTSNSDEDNIFPNIIRNHGVNSVIVWLKGTYTTYLNYDTDVMIKREEFE